MFTTSEACVSTIAEKTHRGKDARSESSSVFLDHYRISHPMAADDYRQGVYRYPREQALTMRNIQPNPRSTVARVVLDVDHPDALLRAFRTGIPKPSWVAESPSGRAHVGYLLAVPVDTLRVDRRVMNFASRIEEALRRELDGDPAYGGHLTKNPLHPDWEVRWGDAALHTLAGMAHQLGTLPGRRPRTGKRPDIAGLGRNCYLFEEARTWAYEAVRRYWDDGPELFAEVVHDHVTELNQLLATPLPASEVKAIASSISRWTWEHFTPEQFRAIQTQRSGKAAAKRTQRAAEREQAVVRLREQGMKWQQVADALGMSLKAAQASGRRASKRTEKQG